VQKDGGTQRWQRAISATEDGDGKEHDNYRDHAFQAESQLAQNRGDDKERGGVHAAAQHTSVHGAGCHGNAHQAERTEGKEPGGDEAIAGGLRDDETQVGVGGEDAGDREHQENHQGDKTPRQLLLSLRNSFLGQRRQGRHGWYEDCDGCDSQHAQQPGGRAPAD
jgi:hypothetical protein